MITRIETCVCTAESPGDRLWVSLISVSTVELPGDRLWVVPVSISIAKIEFREIVTLPPLYGLRPREPVKICDSLPITHLQPHDDCIRCHILLDTEIKVFYSDILHDDMQWVEVPLCVRNNFDDTFDYVYTKLIDIQVLSCSSGCVVLHAAHIQNIDNLGILQIDLFWWGLTVYSPEYILVDGTLVVT